MAEAEAPKARWLFKPAGERSEFRSVCGFRKNVLTPADETPVSISHLRIEDSRDHYHKVQEEIYYVLKGTGVMVLDGERVNIGEGDAVVIRPEVRHHSEGGIEVLIICCPPYEDGDCYFDD